MAGMATATAAEESPLGSYQAARAVLQSASRGSRDREVQDRLRAQFPLPSDDLRAATAAVRDLLRLDNRAERVRRLLRAWSGRVLGSIRAADFVAAGTWMRAVTGDPGSATEHDTLVAEALDDLSRSAVFDELVVALVKAGDPPGAGSLLAAWGAPLVDYLVTQILVEEPRVDRRHIVIYLGMAGRDDIRLIAPLLRDPRWFVVRNVATAVGLAGREGGVAPLMAARDHEDERVRVEVIRALTRLQGANAVPVLAAALSDPSQRVRNAALSLLRAEPSEQVVSVIEAHLTTADADEGEVRRLVRAIGERPTPAARQALDGLAARRFAVGSARLVREAARDALRRVS